MENGGDMKILRAIIISEEADMLIETIALAIVVTLLGIALGLTWGKVRDITNELTGRKEHHDARKSPTSIHDAVEKAMKNIEREKQDEISRQTKAQAIRMDTFRISEWVNDIGLYSIPKKLIIASWPEYGEA
jgi:hypothetical protein